MPKFTQIPLRLRFVLIYLLLASLCLIFYSNTLHSPFLWDDEGLIQKNTLIKDWRLWPKAFSNDLYFGSSTGTNFYRPLQSLSLIWNYHFWELDPFGYHLTNILLQGIVSFLVFLFIYTLSKDLNLSFASSLLFALCPLATEVVTYISGRADILMSLFLLSSFLVFVKSINKDLKRSFSPSGFRMSPSTRISTRGLIYLCLSLFLFVLGLLSKELAVVFPFTLLAYLFYYEKDNLKRIGHPVKVILPFFIVASLYIILRLTLLKFPTSRPPLLANYPLILRITLLPKVIFTYFKLLLLPVNLHMVWTLTIPRSLAAVFLSWLMLTFICVSLVYTLIYKRQQKSISFFLFWSLIFFIPQSGLFPINAFVAEHFIYLSSISFFVFIAYLLRKVLRKELFVFALSGFIAFYGMQTFSRNFDWVDPLVFFERTVKFSPDSFQARNNLGLEYEYRFLYQGAISEYKKALEMRPDLLEAHSNLANLYFKMGRLKEAKKEYQIVQRLAPLGKAGEIQNNLGCVLEVEGEKSLALEKYKLALKLDPTLKFTHFNIARIYFSKGDLDSAAEELLRSFPEIVSSNEGQNPHLKITLAQFKAIKNLNSAYAVTFYNDLGVRFANAGLLEAALSAFKNALEIEPRYADAHFNLGLAYWKLGNKRKAMLEFKTTLRIAPHHSQAKGFLSEIVYPVRDHKATRESPGVSNGVNKKK